VVGAAALFWPARPRVGRLRSRQRRDHGRTVVLLVAEHSANCVLTGHLTECRGHRLIAASVRISDQRSRSSAGIAADRPGRGSPHRNPLHDQMYDSSGSRYWMVSRSISRVDVYGPDLRTGSTYSRSPAGRPRVPAPDLGQALLDAVRPAAAGRCSRSLMPSSNKDRAHTVFWRIAHRGRAGPSARSDPSSSTRWADPGVEHAKLP